MRVEEQYQDVLQNIEFAIVSTRREWPGMADSAVMRAIEALMDAYSGEQIGRPPSQIDLSDDEQRLMENVRDVCQWRLGRKSLEIESDDGELPPPEPITIDEVLICLKRILKSVKKWNKHGGRVGYLDFIVQYVK